MRGCKDQLPFAKILTRHSSPLLDHPLSKLWHFNEITTRKKSQEMVAECEGSGVLCMWWEVRVLPALLHPRNHRSVGMLELWVAEVPFYMKDSSWL